MLSQFSERNYEICLTNELCSTRDIFAPAPFLENFVGIDIALFSRNPRFWRLWSPFWWISFLTPPRRGVPLGPDLWDGIQHDLDSNDFPTIFKANVFIQYKRPQYISNSRGSEYSFWKQGYFKYKIEHHQQNTLSQLERNVTNNALVTYACAAFWKYDELFNYTLNGTLIQNSNFVKPSTLNGHRLYSFINGGTFGRASSEPEDIPKLNLLEELDKLKRLKPKERKNSQFIKSLSKTITQIVEKSDESFKINFDNALKYFKQPENTFGEIISQILSFLFLTNVSWLIIYQKKQRTL